MIGGGMCPTCSRLINAGVTLRQRCPGGSCTRCPWRHCTCTHTEGCDRGWIETTPLASGYEPAMVRCPRCGEAAKVGQMMRGAA